MIEFDLLRVSLRLPSLMGTTGTGSLDGETEAEEDGFDTRPSEETAADTTRDCLVATGNDLEANDSVNSL